MITITFESAAKSPRVLMRVLLFIVYELASLYYGAVRGLLVMDEVNPYVVPDLENFMWKIHPIVNILFAYFTPDRVLSVTMLAYTVVTLVLLTDMFGTYDYFVKNWRLDLKPGYFPAHTSM